MHLQNTTSAVNVPTNIISTKSIRRSMNNNCNARTHGKSTCPFTNNLLKLNVVYDLTLIFQLMISLDTAVVPCYSSIMAQVSYPSLIVPC